MSTQTSFGTKYWANQVLKTRRYGHTYVHSGARAAAEFPFRAFENGGIRFSFCGWGRSLNTGGHKYKVHANCVETGKPVPSNVLKELA